MSADDPVSFGRPPDPRSVRVRIARAALQAALEVPGVLGSDPGPSGARVTADPVIGPLVGVSAAAQSDDRYAIDLSLVANFVPLPALAETVRARVRRRAEEEQLGAVLGAVNVEFASVVTAEEFAAAAAAQQVEEVIVAEELTAGAAIAEQAAEAVAPGPGWVRKEAPDAAAALAAREAALATEQAALAAKQAALAAEQAALAGERAALATEPAASLTSLESEHDAGFDGERKP